MRQYGREDVNYESWYSPWMKQLAKNRTAAELEYMLTGKRREAKAGAVSHLRAIDACHSMAGQSMRRAHARNVTAAAGDYAIAIEGALEIHELFPEHAKSGSDA
jgi:hypothetical protein